MIRRQKNALVLGVCALVLYLSHLGWFLLFGPPEWFDAVGERAPEMTSVALGSGFDPYIPYIDEFARPPKSGLSPQGTDDLPDYAGRIVREDRAPEGGPTLLQTRDDAGDHLYARRTDGESWRELPQPPRGRLSEARWIREGDVFQLLLAVQDVWWPLGRNYGRFWSALVNPALRPGSALFLFDPATVKASYLFAGRLPLPSPDRGAVAFLRSERRGFHSLHIWRPGEADPLTVVSLWEADPGSGPSFYWTWSSDSRVLFVRGTARGSKGNPSRESHAVRLLYDVEGDRLIELAEGTQRSRASREGNRD